MSNLPGAPVRMNDFGAEPEELIRQEIAACERVIRSGWYILGSEVENFERLWADKCQSRFAVGTGNGMDAIEIGLRTLGLAEGDEVITTAMTAFATALGILRAGATPVLADIREEDALLDIDSVRRCISPRTKAVLLVHLYGQLPDMSAWKQFRAENGLLLLEDCAQAHLATDGGKGAGTFGSWGAFSFYPTKNLGALGDGGALVTDSEEIAEKAKRFRNYGQGERYYHPEFGLNSRLDELQAAILTTRLNWLKDFTWRRREIAKLYHSSIRNPKIELLARPRREENHVHHLFVVRCKERDRLLQHLKNQSITSLIHYPVPIHQHDPTRHLRADPEGLLRSENHAATCLSIPCHPQMDEAAAHRVIDALNSFK
jgi:dTDP-4-amino-4,6-dideoxygalactose transaminase